MTDTKTQNNNSKTNSKMVEKSAQSKIAANEYTIDATEKKIGRIATKAAHFLLGKNTASFAKNVVVNIKVKVINASKISVTEKKKKDKIYTRYSGYPAGLKRETLECLLEKKGYSEVIRKAVYGMLPSNKLRAKRIKNLIVKE
ncbi:MAG: 50S ribosomal protein L13 [Candidatus Pacebacteria bacterium]|nr:50S ribosomal protein L13 [Candidatus Paceibacterota bacterium]